MDKDTENKLNDARYILRHQIQHSTEQVSAATEYVKQMYIWHDDPIVRAKASDILKILGGIQ